MSIQDKLERILREMHIMVSRGETSELNEEYVLIHKKEMQKLLSNMSQTVSEMMEHYELTEEGRNRAQLGAEKQRMEIIRDANHQAQDIYAASVIYSEDALGRIQDIIDEAEKSAREILSRLNREMEAEKRNVRSNQLELITQLEDLKDSSKYMRLIEERNREIAKERLKKQEIIQKRKYKDKVETESKEEAANEIQNDEIYDLSEEIIKETTKGFTDEILEESPKEDAEEKIVYEKPVIKVNQQYFQKLEQLSEEDDDIEEEQKEKHQKFFSFGRK